MEQELKSTSSQVSKIVAVLVLVGLIVGAGYYYFTNRPVEQTTQDLTVFAGPVKTFTVDGSSYAYAPSTLTVNKGDKVVINFKDIDGMHNLVIDEYNVKSKALRQGQEQELSFIADKSGTFEMYCSLPNHKEQGMKGTLIVN